MSKPYSEYAARQYPPGKKPDRRRIEKCSAHDAWYLDMVGQIIEVHYFCSFGAWDKEGRWLWYYDLSAPIKEPAIQSIKGRLKTFFKLK